MIALFRRAPRFADPRFGELRWSRGMWTSPNARLCGSTDVRVRIPGSSDGIALEALLLLQSVESHYATIKQQVLPRFHEHYEPYVEALEGLHDLAADIRNPEDLRHISSWSAYGSVPTASRMTSSSRTERHGTASTRLARPSQVVRSQTSAAASDPADRGRPPG